MTVNISFKQFRIDLFNTAGNLALSILETGEAGASNLISADGLQFSGSNGLEYNNPYVESASFTIRSPNPPAAIAPMDSNKNPTVFRRGNKVELYTWDGVSAWQLFATVFMDSFVNDDGKRPAVQGVFPPLEPFAITINCTDLLTTVTTGPGVPNDDSEVTLGVNRSLENIIQSKIRLTLKDNTITLGAGANLDGGSTVPMFQEGSSLASVRGTVQQILHSHPNKRYATLYLGIRPDGVMHIAELDYDGTDYLLNEDLATSNQIKDAIAASQPTTPIAGTYTFTATIQGTELKPAVEVRGPFYERGPINLPINLAPDEDPQIQLPADTIRKVTTFTKEREFSGGYVTREVDTEQIQEITGVVYAASKSTDELWDDIQDTNVKSIVINTSLMSSDRKETIALYEQGFVTAGSEDAPALSQDSAIYFVPRAKLDPPLEAEDFVGTTSLVNVTTSIKKIIYADDQVIADENTEDFIARGWYDRGQGQDVQEEGDPADQLLQGLRDERWQANPQSEDYFHDLSVTDFLNPAQNQNIQNPGDKDGPPGTRFAPSAYDIIQDRVSCAVNVTDPTGEILPLEEDIDLGTSLTDPTKCEWVGANYALTIAGQNGRKTFTIPATPNYIDSLKPVTGNPKRILKVVDDLYPYTEVYAIQGFTIQFTQSLAVIVLDCFLIGYDPASSPVSPPPEPVPSPDPLPTTPDNFVPVVQPAPNYLATEASAGFFVLEGGTGGYLLQ